MSRLQLAQRSICVSIPLLATVLIAAGPVSVAIPGNEGIKPEIHRADRANPDELLGTMESELTRSCNELKDAGETPLYYLSYALTEEGSTRIIASLGSVSSESSVRNRYLDVDLRIGSEEFDNTRESRTFYSFSYRPPTYGPLDNDPLALQVSLWRLTDQSFKEAQERYANLRTEASLESQREDPSGDFSSVEPVRHVEPLVEVSVDFDAWKDRLRSFSGMFRDHPDIYRSSVELEISTKDRYLVSSEGNRVVVSSATARVVVYAWTKADDGMPLYLYQIYDVNAPDRLPDPETVRADITELIDKLEALRVAPVVDPYTGPAILQNEAAAVYFHEIFGHRIEGHRQKSEEEGQTFTDKVGQLILPDFISVYDDPHLEEYAGEDLKGHYSVDDEGVMAQRVDLVVDGVLRNFLMSRNPIEGFPNSNGHGRCQPGLKVVARQGNLVVESSKRVSYDALREQLIEQIKVQDKPFGLIFAEISGGFTSTGRFMPQSFKVEPLLVYRVYPDGRPDELVRGVDIVGTPLTSFSKILTTADDPGIFDGYCGAESGSIPVSGVSPSLLISEIEVEKQAKSPTGLPALPMPPMEPSGTPSLFDSSTSARRALENDQVLLAMGDELTRSMDELQLPDSERPFHLMYRINDQEVWGLQASFGAIIDDSRTTIRRGTIALRVGDMNFDNTQFISMMPPRPGFVNAPIEDGYGAIRHSLWLATDTTYRNALAQLAAKEAFVQNNIVTDKPDDFTAARPVIHADSENISELNREKWRNIARNVSALFRSEEGIQNATVWLGEVRSIRRLVTSDGSIIKQPNGFYGLAVTLQTQAEDGTPLTDYRSWYAGSIDDLPTEREIVREAETLLTEMEAMVQAPEGEPYVGPLLLLGQASGEFFAQLFAEELSNPREPLFERELLSSRYGAGALANRLNRRILPSSFQIVDDPTMMSWGGKQLLGHYAIDDEGVEAQRLSLVEDGWLRDLPMSRAPSRNIEQSNGHGRAGSSGFAQGMPANLLISTSEPRSVEDLKTELIELARLSQSPYGILVTQLQVPFARAFVGSQGLELLSAAGSAIDIPIVAYRVYVEDGRVEMVRGYRFEEVSARTLKDILGATASENLVQTSLAGSPINGIPLSVVAPDILLEEVVMTPIKGQRPKLPYLARPLPDRNQAQSRLESGTAWPNSRLSAEFRDSSQRLMR